MSTRHRIVIGDARRMEETPDESVHLVITSPPYWQLKDYGTKAQIGFHHTYEDYINDLNLVWKECGRVLEKGCRLCINIGDQFARSAYYGRYKVIPIRTEIIRFCETLGLDYMGAVIWRKVTNCNTTGGATIMGSFPFPRNGILKLDYEFILLFKKPGRSRKPDPADKAASSLTIEEWNTYFSGHWSFAGERQDRHLAMFPEELPRRLIRMFSFRGDWVLDPFLGSGTTTLAAKNLERNSVGYEINEAFVPLIEEKTGSRAGDVEMVRQKGRRHQDFSQDLEALPYLFKDPVPFEKRKDPGEGRYGSRVRGPAKKERERYFRVKKVVSPVEVVLDDGRSFRLLGLKTKRATEEAARDFLEKRTRGQSVYLRFEKGGCPTTGVRTGYLYLKNRTFVNRHLLRQNLVDRDDSMEHKL